MPEFEIWIYRTLIAIMAVVLWFAIQRLIKKFDELIRSINELTLQNQSHNDQLKLLNDVVKEHRERLNKHGDRIRDIELHQTKK